MQRLQALLDEKEKTIKIMQFKLKELTKGGATINISEKTFLDVQQMVNMTGSSKLPLSLQQKRRKEAGELYNFRNRTISKQKTSGRNSTLSRSMERSIDNSASLENIEQQINITEVVNYHRSS